MPYKFSISYAHVPVPRSWFYSSMLYHQQLQPPRVSLVDPSPACRRPVVLFRQHLQHFGRKQVRLQVGQHRRHFGVLSHRLPWRHPQARRWYHELIAALLRLCVWKIEAMRFGLVVQQHGRWHLLPRFRHFCEHAPTVRGKKSIVLLNYQYFGYMDKERDLALCNYNV